jgi:cobalt-zinc-cadmium efflux system protein
VLIEVIYGVLSNSVALIADAGHNFSDVIALVLALIASILIRKRSTDKYSYGFKKGSILIAVFNSFLLLIALGFICREAIGRFYSPSEVSGKTVIVVAFIGIIINGFTAFMFFKGKEKDLNIKSAFLHMLTDALVSAGVVVSGILIYMFNIVWIDPVMSLVISAVIFVGTWRLFKETIRLSIDAVPENIDINEVRNFLKGLNGVSDIHDLHIWSLSTSEVALTVHLVMAELSVNGNFLAEIQEQLHEKFEIGHTTIQIERPGNSNACSKC